MYIWSGSNNEKFVRLSPDEVYDASPKVSWYVKTESALWSNKSLILVVQIILLLYIWSGSNKYFSIPFDEFNPGINLPSITSELVGGFDVIVNADIPSALDKTPSVEDPDIAFSCKIVLPVVDENDQSEDENVSVGPVELEFLFMLPFEIPLVLPELLLPEE